MITLKEYFLINIRQNKVRVENLKTGQFLESDDMLTFGNERLLITDTNEPERTLKLLISQLSAVSLIKPSRTLIINPSHPNIVKFTEMEKMGFRDLAEHLGARIVRFKFGDNVTSRQLDIRAIENQTET
jgi:hypothetical protein